MPRLVASSRCLNQGSLPLYRLPPTLVDVWPSLSKAAEQHVWTATRASQPAVDLDAGRWHTVVITRPPDPAAGDLFLIFVISTFFLFILYFKYLLSIIILENRQKSY
jgi:hypothetical protein